MPYIIKKFKYGYKVYNKETNKPLSIKYFDTYEKALKQMRAIIINELRRR